MVLNYTGLYGADFNSKVLTAQEQREVLYSTANKQRCNFEPSFKDESVKLPEQKVVDSGIKPEPPKKQDDKGNLITLAAIGLTILVFAKLIS